MFLGKLPIPRSPTSGQPVILAEKCEENTYTLIEPPSNQNAQKKQTDSNLTSKQCGVSISCEESINFRELSPTVEPFIPEKV